MKVNFGWGKFQHGTKNVGLRFSNGIYDQKHPEMGAICQSRCEVVGCPLPFKMSEKVGSSDDVSDAYYFGKDIR